MLKRNRIWKVFGCLVLLMLLSGCRTNAGIGFTYQGTTFYFTTGIQTDTVMKGQETELTSGQAELLLKMVRENYTDILSVNIWDVEVEGQAFSVYVDEAVKAMAAKLVLVNMFAAENGISLDNNELEAAEARGEKFYETRLAEDDDVSLSEVVDLMKMLDLSDKVYEELTAGVNTEISVDEARIIKIQYIYSKDSIRKLENALEELEEGNEFQTVAAKYSSSTEYQAELGRGEVAKEFEEAAFNLASGEVSGIISCDNGYYVVKCLDDNIEEQAESQKEHIIESRKEVIFAEFISNYAKNAYISFDEKEWNKVIEKAAVLAE